MDNIFKTKFVQLKEHFNFQVDVKNITFYHHIKNIVNKTVFLTTASTLSFTFSYFFLNGYISFSSNMLFTLIFLPFFLSYIHKLNIKYQPKFTRLSSHLPSFLRFFSLIKSAEDSFFFSKDKISTLLSHKDFQLVFYDFFNMAKNHLLKHDEQRMFSKNLILFKSCLESGKYHQASDYFMELYSTAHQFEYLAHDDYQSAHDIELLKTRKKIIDDFLSYSDLDLSQQNIKSKSIFLEKNIPTSHNFSQDTKKSDTTHKINWKKLMDD